MTISSNRFSSFLAQRGFRASVLASAVAAAVPAGLTATSGCVMPGQKPVLGTSMAALAAPCGPEALIDDGEDNNNQGVVSEGRGGYWYTYMDETGSTIEPMAGSLGGVFMMSEGGANGSNFAMRMHGQLSSAAINFGAMGVNFTDPKDLYDASMYSGVTFWAKKGPGGIDTVRVKFPSVQTDPEGGMCQKCYDDFGMDIKLSTSWKQYTILFSKTRQLGWGDPKRRLDTTGLFAMHFQAQAPGAGFDLWVDDIAFVGCGGQ